MEEAEVTATETLKKHLAHPLHTALSLDTMGKMLKRLLLFELAGGLPERQYGFQRTHSTIDAIAAVMDLAREVSA